MGDGLVHDGAVVLVPVVVQDGLAPVQGGVGIFRVTHMEIRRGVGDDDDGPVTEGVHGGCVANAGGAPGGYLVVRVRGVEARLGIDGKAEVRMGRGVLVQADAPAEEKHQNLVLRAEAHPRRQGGAVRRDAALRRKLEPLACLVGLHGCVGVGDDVVPPEEHRRRGKQEDGRDEQKPPGIKFFAILFHTSNITYL